MVYVVIRNRLAASVNDELKMVAPRGEKANRKDEESRDTLRFVL